MTTVGRRSIDNRYGLESAARCTGGRRTHTTTPEKRAALATEGTYGATAAARTGSDCGRGNCRERKSSGGHGNHVG